MVSLSFTLASNPMAVALERLTPLTSALQPMAVLL